MTGLQRHTPLRRIPMPARATVMPRQSKPIARESAKRRRDTATYRQLRVVFLADRPWCESPWPCGQRATEVHHKRGRVGALYLAVEHWAPLCHSCHHRATVNPAEAYETGISERRVA